MQFQQKVKKYFRNRQRRRKLTAVMGALSVVVALIVALRLMQPAVTMTPSPVCGQTEHVHSSACYPLICGLEEGEEHQHTSACYSAEPACGLAEHIHGPACYPEVIDDPVIVPAEPEDTPAPTAQPTPTEESAPTEAPAKPEPAQDLGEESASEGTPALDDQPEAAIVSLSASHSLVQAGSPVTFSFSAQGASAVTASIASQDGKILPVSLAPDAAEYVWTPQAAGRYTFTLTADSASASCHVDVEPASAFKVSFASVPAYSFSGEELSLSVERVGGSGEIAYSVQAFQDGALVYERDHTSGQDVTDPIRFQTQLKEKAGMIRVTLAATDALGQLAQDDVEIPAPALVDREKAADWESTLRGVTLTGVWPDDLLSVAYSQLGYRESADNYIIDEKGTHGYTRYGEWAGYAYTEWCAAYATFALRYAGISQYDFPGELNCQRWVRDLTQTGLYARADQVEPRPGDLIFYDWQLDGAADHVGIVSRVDGNYIVTIEGNWAAGDVDGVVERRVEANSLTIAGFGLVNKAYEATLPVQPSDEEAASDEPNAEATEPAEDSKEEESEEENTEDAETPQAGERLFQGADFTVRVSYGESAGLPGSVELAVREILPGTEEYAAYAAQMDTTLTREGSEMGGFARLFDISFLLDGQELEPQAPVQVEITFASAVDMDQESELKAVHFAETGAEVLDTDSASDGAAVAFETDSFSVFGVVQVSAVRARVITADGETFVIELTFGPEAGIPESAQLVVEEIPAESELYKWYLAEAKEMMADPQAESIGMPTEKSETAWPSPTMSLDLGGAFFEPPILDITMPDSIQDGDVLFDGAENAEPGFDIPFARFFDIHIIAGEEELEPNAPVQVKIIYDGGDIPEGQPMYAVHFAQSGTEIIEATTTTTQDNRVEVVFEQDSFSVTGTVVGGASTNVSSAGWPDAGSYVMVVKAHGSNDYYAVRAENSSTNSSDVVGSLTAVTFNEATGEVTFPNFVQLDEISDFLWQHDTEGYRHVLHSNVSRKMISPYYNSYYKNSQGFVNYPDSPNASNVQYLTLANGMLRGTSTSSSSYPSYYYLTVNESTGRIGGQYFSDGQTAASSTEVARVWFANGFQVDSSVPPPTPVDTEHRMDAPIISKTLTPNIGSDGTGDGTYELALSVTGKAHNWQEYSKANVLFVIDTSNSMTYYKDTERLAANTDPNQRMNIERRALVRVAKKLLEFNNEHSDAVQIAALAYNTKSPVSSLTWSDSQEAIESYLNGLSPGSGYSGATNWESALVSAKNIADSARTDATTYVVFISDGNPTIRRSPNGHTDVTSYGGYHYDIDGVQLYGNGYEQTQNIQWCYETALPAALSLENSGYKFYSLSVFGNLTNMQKLAAYAYSGSESGSYPADRYHDANDEESIVSAFNGIISEIQTKMAFVNVGIDDPITALTATALTPGETAGNVNYYRSGGKNNDGTTKYDPSANGGRGVSFAPQNEGINEAVYEGGSLKWNLGNDYVLEHDVTYTVTFTVWPKQEAYDLVADLNNGVRNYEGLSEEEKKQVFNSGGTYMLNTNGDAVNTYQVLTTTTQGSQTIESRSDEESQPFINPPAIDLTDTRIMLRKKWDDALAPTQLKELEAYYHSDLSVELDLYMDDRLYDSYNISYHEEGATPDAQWPPQEVNIATGLMVSTLQGVDDPDQYLRVTLTMPNGTSQAFYILEEGHDYEVKEPNPAPHFELVTDVYHPMLIDKKLCNVKFTYDGAGKPTGGKVLETNLTELLAINALMARVDIAKEVWKGDEQIYPDETFTVHGSIVDKNGAAFIRSSSHVGFGDFSPVQYVVFTTRPGFENSVTSATAYDEISQLERKGIENSASFEITFKPGETIRILNLPTGSQFQFQEVSIPDGYYLVAYDAMHTHYDNEDLGTPELHQYSFTDQEDFVKAGYEWKKVSNMSEATIDDTIDTPEMDHIVTVRNALADREISFKKVDELGNILPGAQFTLYRDEECEVQATKVDGTPAVYTSGSDGIVNVKDIPVGIYYMKETASPEGYSVSPAVYKIEIGDRNSTMTTHGDNAPAYSLTEDGLPIIVNKRRIDLRILKHPDLNPDEGLPGAKFRLYTDHDCTVEAVHADGSPIGEVVTDSKGKVSLGDLAYGTYYLKETKAPDGYLLLTAPIMIVVEKTEENLPKVVYSRGDSTIADSETTTSQIAFIIKVGNSSGYALPNTGGSGNSWFTFGGLTLIALSAVMYGCELRRRRERRSKRT